MRRTPAVALLFALAACSGGTSLLAGKTAAGVPGAEKLTDGHFAQDGDNWLAPPALEIPPGAALVWDFGAPTSFDSLVIQADNNDDYVFSISDDGVTWRQLWVAPPVPEPGLATRSAKGLNATGRFLRIDPRGGDGHYSITEVEVLPRGAVRLPSINRLDALWALLWLVTAAAVFGTGFNRRAMNVLVAANALVALYTVSETLREAHVEAPRINFIRAVVAGLAFLAVLRERWRPARDVHEERYLLSVLGASAVLALLCFLNLGRPQFFDAGKGQPTFLHHYDMRTYYLIAKYLPELRFDGVYVASAQAVADERGRDAMRGQPLRDLRNHQMTRFADVFAHADEVRARFSDERWAMFKVDCAYFRKAMTDFGFLDSMHDHGGNATPVWFLLAWLLFKGSVASDAALWSGVLLDVALVLLAFFTLWRGFGLRAALVGATIFGAQDFYQFGTNWFGAAMRHDWLALWCIALWALKANRPFLSGALLSWSTLIRAFPALAFITLAVPHVWTAVRTRSWSLKPHADLLRTAAGAIVTALALFIASGLAFGFHVWVEWLEKVSRLNKEDHINNLAIHTWVANNAIAYPIVALLCIALIVYALRDQKPPQAAAYGVILLPVVLNPANYYLHAVFLLTVLGLEASLVWLALLLMCSASYLTSFTTDITVHFRWDTYVLLTALAVVVWTAVRPKPRVVPDSRT
jgi:hypothetical protein